MRVLHVIKGLGPGGAERLLVSMTAARRPGTEIAIAYLLPHKDHLVAEAEAAGARTYLLAGGRGLADPRWPFRLARLVTRFRPDVVHLHSPAVAAVARPIIRSMPSRPALFSTEHNEWPSFGRLTRLANAATLPLSDVHLAVSEEVRASMGRRHRDRTEVLIHGIPVAELVARRGDRHQARRELGVADDEVVVVIVANFREKKDYPTLLRAAVEATAAEPRLRFLSVGQGPLQETLERERDRLGLARSFRFLGYQRDPVRILAAADIFTLTSRHEGLSIALLEALALGLPAVVSEVGGMKSVMADLEGAHLVPSGDASGFAATYVDLARDPELRGRMARSAAEHAKRFDISVAQRWLEDRYRATRGAK